MIVPVAHGTVSVTLQPQDGSRLTTEAAGELGEASLFAAVVPRPTSPSASALFLTVVLTGSDGTTSTCRVIAPAPGGPPPVPTTR